MKNRAALGLLEKLSTLLANKRNKHRRADEVSREMNSKLCEWCDKDTTIVCSLYREIHLCSKGGHVEVVKELLRGEQASTRPRRTELGPLRSEPAGSRGGSEGALKAGADPTLAADNGATALGGARHFGHTRIVQPLQEHGATA